MQTEVSWTALLREGFGNVSVPPSSSSGAVLVVRVSPDAHNLYFAFTFGVVGRFMLRPGAWERGFGLRTALNAIYEGDDGSDTYDVSRLRAVEAKRVAANTIRARYQANRSTTMEAFDVDVRRDLLHRVDGPPARAEHWGHRVGGADAFQINVEKNFDQLGQLCRRIQSIHDASDYQQRFSWIDNTRVVEDTRALEALILDELQSGAPANLELTIPEMIEWSLIDGFQFPIDRRGRKTKRIRRPGDPRLTEYLGSLGDELTDLDVERLKRDRLFAVDADGETKYQWRLWDCLTGEFALSGDHYILDEGTLYEVAADYQAAIEADINQLVEWNGSLPTARRGTKEDEYNLEACESEMTLLLMDKRLVRPTRGTGSVEVCDILKDDGTFVHVKIGWGASIMSHLFAQGATSAELLHGDVDFRDSALARVREAEEEKVASSGDNNLIGRFQGLLTGDGAPIGTRDVVFAIIGDWRGRSLVEALPFFSKVNLRDTRDRLRRAGFQASYKRIESSM